MSTVVNLTAIWLNLADDPSDYVALDTNIDLSRQVSQDGRVDSLAGGRFRAIKSEGRPRQWSFPARVNDPADVAWLESNVGKTVCARDPRGHKFFAIYWGITSVDHDYADNEGADVTLSLAEVTHVEAL